MKKHLVLKVIVSLLPSLILTQNWAWVSDNKFVGIAFVVLWALMIGLVWKLDNKNQILQKIFRTTEIAFFLLPISAIVLTFVIGAQTTGSSQNEFEQAGAAIGTAIGGTFVVGLVFVVGLFGGIIMHLVANRYEKKADKASAIK